MYLRISLFIIITFSFVFCLNEKSYFDNYHELIDQYPQFLNYNYFEDDNYYYYLTSYDYNTIKETRRFKRNKIQSIENAKSKARLHALSNLFESICCGFDITNINKRLRKANLIDLNNNKLSHTFSVKSSIQADGVEVMVNMDTGNTIVYAVRINKNITLDYNVCECNFIIN